MGSSGCCRERVKYLFTCPGLCSKHPGASPASNAGTLRWGTGYAGPQLRHQKFVGTGYFDAVTEVVTQGMASTTALEGSTEEEQFQLKPTRLVIKIGHDPACQPIQGDCPDVAPAPKRERMAGD